MNISLTALPAFSDNYIWLAINMQRSTAAIIDPGTADTCIDFLENKQISPVAILITHRHWDHTGGIAELLARYDIPVFGPANEKIQGITDRVTPGDHIKLDKIDTGFDVMDLSGHTSGHVGYLTEGVLFCGDTLFSAGCGRLFDGTAAQLYASLQRISALPGDTKICCAHEYTLDNLSFAATIEPDNSAIQQRIDEVRQLRSRDLPSLPVELREEKRYNPFLRTHLPAIATAVADHSGKNIDDSEQCFTALRMWKDGF